jgi:glycerate kinase
MKIIISPDKFKGSLTAFEACEAIEEGIRSIMAEAEIHSFPMADGGDGFSRILGYYLQTQTISCSSVDANGRPITAKYGYMPGSKSAVIEVAAANGIAKISPDQYSALYANTYGTGLLINDAIRKGASTIILGLGGSATTDMGTGILHALGFRFFDSGNNPIIPGGAMLNHIERVEYPPNLPQVKFIMACDVTNPLYGSNGAAFVFAPQKGADASMVIQLDEGLRHANRIFGTYSGGDFSLVPGAGAAGGIAAGLSHFFDVDIQSGFDLVLEASRLKEVVHGAHWLFTGEGRFDAQSFQGKVTGRLMALSKMLKLPVVVFCGSIQSIDMDRKNFDNTYVVPLVNEKVNRDEAISNAAAYLTERVKGFLSNVRDAGRNM